MNSRAWRLRFAVRPILGLLIRGQPIPIPTRTIYVVQHPRFDRLVLRDPYRAGAGDPRHDWTRDMTRAARYVTVILAERAAADSGHGGRVLPIALPP